MKSFSLPSKLISTALLAGAFLFSPALEAAPSPSTRVTEIRADRYFEDAQVVRARTPGKTSVSFSAQPETIPQGAVAFFEINSLSQDGKVSRWTCIATKDVSECLGKPVKVKYLQHDQAMALTVRMLPSSSIQTGAMVAGK